MRIIDGDALIDTLKNMCCADCNLKQRSIVNSTLHELLPTIIDDEPTIEATPIRRGRWIEKPPYEDETVKGLEFQIVCSRCDEQNSSITFDENSVPIAKTFWKSRFCPNCGAMMR